MARLAALAAAGYRARASSRRGPEVHVVQNDTVAVISARSAAVSQAANRQSSRLFAKSASGICFYERKF